jgi:hypothetical protein
MGTNPAGANKANAIAGDRTLLILFFLNICFPLKVIYLDRSDYQRWPNFAPDEHCLSKYTE